MRPLQDVQVAWAGKKNGAPLHPPISGARSRWSLSAGIRRHEYTPHVRLSAGPSARERKLSSTSNSVKRRTPYLLAALYNVSSTQHYPPPPTPCPRVLAQRLLALNKPAPNPTTRWSKRSTRRNDRSFCAASETWTPCTLPGFQRSPQALLRPFHQRFHQALHPMMLLEHQQNNSQHLYY